MRRTYEAREVRDYIKDELRRCVVVAAVFRLLGEIMVDDLGLETPGAEDRHVS